ncbi:penicillin-binding transpeptidase domain-containing protein [Candidatus Clostridium stratigraminis]|uniref:Penicillin-binding transpeptidase domain-containing protein n=1 Tax=Candidatus Clostridium stratigraminis TaxID=3381661 RepID=A0ABW8T6Y4_9CLOT
MKKKENKFNRYSALTSLVVLVFVGIITRLVYLQIVKGAEYKDKANTKAITELQQNAPRGNILASDGVTKLATNVQSYNLTFTQTDESSISFFDTMDSVFKILDDNKEVQKDDLQLKINPYRFEFNTTDEDTKKAQEIRFKKDRGLDQYVIENTPELKNKKGKLTAEDKDKIDELLLKITPEQTYDYMVNNLYKVTPEGIFKSIIGQYKTSPDDTLNRISTRYKISADSELKDLLTQYSKASKQAVKDDLFSKLMTKCQVDKTKLPKDKEMQLERRYLLVLDAIKMQSFSGYKPVTIASNIKKETAFIFAQKLNDMPGIDTDMQPMRTYPYGELASSVIGYISKITNSDKYDIRGYDVNSDYIGVQGIEAAFEDRLKGTKGGTIVKLNTKGRVIEELGSSESSPGQTIQLTIDKNVQYAAEKALDQTMASLQKAGRQNDVNTQNATRGAAVAIDVNTGAVLALVSRPGFNPNDFSNPAGLTTDVFNKYFNPDYVKYGQDRGLSSDLINKLFPVNSNTNKRYDKYDYVPKYLYNYATSSLVPPGSTFKPATAVAALESGVITPSFSVDDHSVFNDNKGTHKTFYDDGPGYGWVDLTRALAVSSNPYFMTVGQKLRETYNDDILAKYAWKLGLGTDPKSNANPTTGIEIGDNYGQVFNSTSIKNNYAINTWYSIEEELKKGQGNKISNFDPIDLYDNKNDSTEVIDVKAQIKAKVLDFTKNGGFISDEYKNNSGKRDQLIKQTYSGLLNQLISADPQYKDKKISTNVINLLATDMYDLTLNSYGQSSLPFNMYDASIGQGMDNFTPLQLANYVATIVNGGNRYKLHLVDKIMDPSGKVIEQEKPEVLEKTGIKQNTIDAVKAGMHAVTGEDGTARGVFDGLPIDTAGKTGSATFSQIQNDIGRTSYGVYVGFAPFDKPKIAVAIMVFDGGHGGFVAPVARAMYEAYFKTQLDAEGYKPKFDVAAQPIK